MKREDFKTRAGYVMAVIKAMPQKYTEVFVNGCGSSVVILRRFKLPEKWEERFYYACAVHDVAYWIGGSRLDRWQDDIQFLFLCIKLAGDNVQGLRYAFRSGFAVLIGGGIVYEYRDKPRTYKEMINLGDLKLEARKYA